MNREIAVGDATGMRALAAPSALVASGVGVAFAVAIEHGQITRSYVQARASLVVGAIAIASAAALMTSAVAVAMRGLSDTRPEPAAAPRRRSPPAPG